MTIDINRRSLLTGGLAAALAGIDTAMAGDVAKLPTGQIPSGQISSGQMPIGDMHAHLFFIGPKPASLQPLARNMASGGATLVSWSLVGDMPWIRPSPTGLRQVASAKSGEATDWLDRELERVHVHLKEQRLKVVRAPADLDRALAGEPHVVLSVEGASFLDDGLGGLDRAYKAGIRHVQLVHYVRNTIGDFQTEKPEYGGLTNFGRDVIRECNRLGILVDLAHCTSDAVRQALETSTTPTVWSHSSVVRDGRPNWKLTPWRARQLGLTEARAIAAKGGVIGIWALRSDVGGTIEAYATRVAEMAELIGAEHVAFGTDINALIGAPVQNYAHLRQAVSHLSKLGLEPARVQKIAIGNYARVLRQAMDARKA